MIRKSVQGKAASKKFNVPVAATYLMFIMSTNIYSNQRHDNYSTDNTIGAGML